MSTEITNKNFKELTNKGIVLVDFWAPWCGPCRLLGPAIEELAEDFEDQDVVIGKVNLDDYPDLASKYNVKSIPTMAFLRNGILVDQLIGVHSKEKIKEKLDSLLN